MLSDDFYFFKLIIFVLCCTIRKTVKPTLF
jgi:hypothetical protein